MVRTGDQPQAAPPGRAPGLDGLRGLAVLAVLAFHEKVSGLPGGFLGVDVFFTISGYLITDLLAAPWSTGGRLNLRTFWLRRARRLLPCLLVMLVTATAAVAVLEPGQLPALRPALLAAVTYTSNWWQAAQHQSYFTAFGPPPPLQHLWSLAIEEQFYLLWPIILTVILGTCRRRRTRATVVWAGAAAAAIAMAAGYLGGVDPSRLYYGTDTHATALLVGAALALTWPLRRVVTASAAGARRLDLAGLVGVTVLALEMGELSGQGGALYLGGIAVAAVAAGAVVVAAAGPGVLGEILGWAPLRWVGIRSYGIYLWHWPVIALFAARTGAQSTAFGVRVAETVTAIGLAAVCWRWVEKPIILNGAITTLRASRTAAVRSMVAVRQSPRRALPALLPLAALTLTGTAAFGVLYSPSGPTLRQQLATGARISAATQAGPAGGASGVARAGSAGAGSAGAGSASARSASATSRGPAGLTRAILRTGVTSGVTAIGDSVMVASAAGLRAALPGITIDAQVGRQMSQGVSVAGRLSQTGRLRTIVVVGLGTNGAVSMRQLDTLRSLAGPDRMLVLVTAFVPRPWQNEVNGVLAAAARRDHDVLLANWFAAISGRTSLLWPDGVHPRPAGAAVYARVVAAAVRQAATRLGQAARVPPPRPDWQPPGGPWHRLGG